MLILPIILLVVIWLWPTIWFQIIHKRIELDVHVMTEQVKQDEWIELQVQIRNRAWLPCPYMEFSLQLPSGLIVHPDAEPDHNTVRFQTYLFSRQETSFQIKCYAMHRGPYKLHEAVLEVNEGFGLRTLRIYAQFEERVYVSPSLSDMSLIETPFLEIMGQIEMIRWLFPDEAMLRGIREYQRGDSFKHIAWLASARNGGWMTKQFASSTDARTFIILNAQVSDPYWERVPRELFDPLCTIAAVMAFQLAKKGLTAEFVSNAVFEKYPKIHWFGLQKSDGIQSLLGKAHSLASFPFERILKRFFQLDTDRTVVFLITRYLSVEQEKMIQRLAQRGMHIVLITGAKISHPVRSCGNVTVIHHPYIEKSEMNPYVS